ncbi:MAG: putative glutamine amidotransferase [Bacillota bacterium]|jgi:putative glutamine amidotransferase|nr:putative glutamine amidotransferase [Bacillota bacterium]MDK2924979.1 putative glutamine amidotransferase [Bacillota bacterium]
MRPIIAISMGYKKGTHYLNDPVAEAILLAGGLPWPMPVVSMEVLPEILARAHGVLLPGGEDVDPAAYGEAPEPQLGPVNAERDACELALARLAWERHLPIFGICRGAQVLNVARGGSLIQDIPSAVAGALGHRQGEPYDRPVHSARVDAASRLARILGQSELEVNSMHHQSVKVPGRGLKVVAWAPDGVVEGIESQDPDRFALGVQWHPEYMVDPVSGSEAMRRLFAAFIAAAADSLSGGRPKF